MKRVSLIVLFFFFIVRSFAQPNCTAKILNAKDGRIDACFVRTPNPIGNVTKYTILASGLEIYEVEFTYDKEGDSILIRFYDKQNTSVKLQSVKLKPEDSHFLICDFKPNQKQIKNENNYQILFGIDNPNQQFITLYQFQAIGGVQSEFVLQDVPFEILTEHAKAVLDYEKIVSIRESHDFYVRRLKREMIDYKDSVINTLKDNENTQRSKEATLVADKALQADFSSKMDSIFINYFKNIHSFYDEVYDIDFSFSCDGYGKIHIDTLKTIYFKSSQQRNWFKDSFIQYVKPLIEKDVYNTLSDTYANPRLKDDFSNWFDNKFNSYTALGKADLDSFVSTKDYVNQELESYKSRTLSVPTLYHYTFKYTSSVKQPIWRYVKDANGSDKFIDKSDNSNRVEITDDLKHIFRNKYGSLRKGKYKVKVSTITINDNKYFAHDILLVESK